MKTCPFCAEDVQDAAIVCKHCGRDLTGEATAAPPAAPPAPAKKKTSPITIGCLIVFIAFIGFGIVGSLINPTPRSSQPAARPEIGRSTPVPSAPVAQGLGVGIAQFETTFGPLGFAFERSSQVRGQSRVMAKHRDGLSYLELIGDEDDLNTASLMLGFTRDVTAIRRSGELLLMAKIAVPEWDNAPEWLRDNIPRAMADGAAATAVGPKKVRLQGIKQLGMLMLTISVQ